MPQFIDDEPTQQEWEFITEVKSEREQAYEYFMSLAADERIELLLEAIQGDYLFFGLQE
jgi:hypothetical protein